MLELPQVTLVAMTGKDEKAHLEALYKSAEGIKWGKILLLSTEAPSLLGLSCRSDEKMNAIPPSIHRRRIDPIDNIDDWNYKIIYKLPNYIDTEFALLVHADGYVINPHLWDPAWLNYDYIGAPWPLPTDDFSYRDDGGHIIRVGNSVSLRSKKLMNAAARISEKEFWAVKDKFGNTNEDGFICCHNGGWLRRNENCNFAPLDVAVRFSKEHEIPENVGLSTFAFHSL